MSKKANDTGDYTGLRPGNKPKVSAAKVTRNSAGKKDINGWKLDDGVTVEEILAKIDAEMYRLGG